MEQPISSKQLADLAFRQAWQGIFVFVVPAGLAVLAGYYLDNRWQSGKTWTMVSLLIALIVSWLITWRRYASFQRIVRQVKASRQINQSDSIEQPKP